jgi:DNA helicase-2/ATP-dependent DNA helicase PcrA
MTYTDFKKKYNISLNEQQDAAVQAVTGPTLLLAVPGSGKTTVLIARIGYMIYGCGIRPEEILVVTYTKAATADMKKRFVKVFGEEYADRLTFCTINSLADKILTYFSRITGKSRFGVADKEGAAIIKEAFRYINHGFATENDIKNIQTAITYVKNMRYTKAEIDKYETEVENFPDIYEAYNNGLRNNQMIDYDDQMVYALRILEKYPDVLEHFRKRYKYFCVDEAQDTSKIQHDIIGLLAAQTENLFMVGDEDQSIYGFRAAYPAALIGFEKAHKNAKVLLMESNYRSRAEIVRAADKLIQYNRNRHEKHVKETKSAGNEVKQINVVSRKDQYGYLAAEIEKSNKEIAVLYRNTESVIPLIDIFDRKGIPYNIKQGEVSFFTHPIVSDIVDFIQFAENPCDVDIFMRIYYKLGAGISKTMAQAACYSCKGDTPLLKWIIRQEAASKYTKQECSMQIKNFDSLKDASGSRAMGIILNLIGYSEQIREKKMDSGKVNVMKIIGEQAERATLIPKRLDELKDLLLAGSDKKANVILSTIHSSKGLEYDTVYMLDMCDGILPGCEEPKRNATPAEKDAYEEERRLFYVGMTRAKESLNIFTFQKDTMSPFSKVVFGTPEKASKTELHKHSAGLKPSLFRQSVVSEVSESEVQELMAKCVEGVRIRHEKYGSGIIVRRDGKKADVNFELYGSVKTLHLPIVLQTKMVALEQ